MVDPDPYLILGDDWTTHLKKFTRRNWIISPRDEHEKYLKPPPSIHVLFNLNLKCLVILWIYLKCLGSVWRILLRTFLLIGVNHIMTALCIIFWSERIKAFPDSLGIFLSWERVETSKGFGGFRLIQEIASPKLILHLDQIMWKFQQLQEDRMLEVFWTKTPILRVYYDQSDRKRLDFGCPTTLCVRPNCGVHALNHSHPRKHIVWNWTIPQY